jgi:hypothetical protein
MNMPKIPVYQVRIPEYTVRTPPDCRTIGERIDKVLKRHFLGRRLAIRCLSSKDHHGKSVDDLVRIIKKLGTDHYSKRRKGDRYENVEGKKIDFFALERNVRLDSVLMEQFIYSFYFQAKQFGFTPRRVDIIIVYDRASLRRVFHTYADGRRKSDGYVFRDPQHKRDAVLGIVKLL